MGFDKEQIAESSAKAVKEDLRGSVWPVYEHYEIVEENGEVFVVAPVSLASFVESEPEEERVIREGRLKGRKWQRFAGRDPIEDGMPLHYAPLRVPELVLELAELAENSWPPKL